MRPAANFTLHAILAACLAALAASSAAAKPQIDNGGHAYLTISLMGSGSASHGPQLEVHGFTSGPRQSALKLDRCGGGSAAGPEEQISFVYGKVSY